MIRPGFTADSFRDRQVGTLPDLLGIEVDALRDGVIEASLQIQPHHQAPNGFLHAASVIALADTTAGYGCMAHAPEGSQGFTTIELKTNFLGTALTGRIAVVATLVHGGRTTQVWDATVTAEGGKTLALFRCTQMILWPR